MENKKKLELLECYFGCDRANYWGLVEFGGLRRNLDALAAIRDFFEVDYTGVSDADIVATIESDDEDEDENIKIEKIREKIECAQFEAGLFLRDYDFEFEDKKK